MQYHKEYTLIYKLIKDAKSIIVIPHINPDPDALSSSYALAKTFLNLGINTVIGLQEKLCYVNKYAVPDKSLFIYPTQEEISSLSYDIVITTDIGGKSRVGLYLDLVNKAKTIINLDHHIDNDSFGHVNIVDSSFSSTAELVYEFLHFNNICLSKDIACSLYTGIVFDTGSFRYSLTSPKTHKYVSSILQSFDIDTNAVYESLFENFNLSYLKLIACVGRSLETFYDGKLILSYLKRSFLLECEASENDANNLVKLGSSLKGNILSIFMKEKNSNEIKVSLRSKSSNIKVNRIAKQFGGGGHEKASGFSLALPFDKAYNLIMEQIVNEHAHILSEN